MSDGATSTSTPNSILTASPAFRAALLQSEVRRAYVVLVLLALAAVLVVTHDFSQDLDVRIPVLGSIGLLVLIAIQLAVLSFARWARRRERGFPAWFAMTTVVIECLVPTSLILFHIVAGTFPPYIALTSPPILAYAILIGLTTLRLRPVLCIVAGVVSAGSYLAVFLYVRFGIAAPAPVDGLPRAAYITAAALIFLGGIGAALVAREIRALFEVALREAETRKRMDRIAQDMSVARTIQQALLPRSAPDIPGYQIAGWNRPADETGGDYYDWQPLPDGKWIISLADVSGHGIGPALVTAACRAYVRASSHYDGDLASLTARVNRLLADDLPEGRFVTMASVLVDPRGGPLGLLSAGHGPILLRIHATGEVEEILPQGVPLAVVPDGRFGPAQSISLAPGDVLALITDGFFEWSRQDPDGRSEQFGLARLRDSLRRHADLAPSAMIAALAADAAAFAGTEPQQDDLTAVIVKRVASSA